MGVREPNFWLGTHRGHWLETARVPLFVSRRQLAARRKLPRATAAWVLDSGGFSELSLHGRWTLSARQYSSEVTRWSREVGNLAWAAAMDWMCEPAVLARTGLDVAAHQRRTVENYRELRSLAPDLPWVPVLQGWNRGDYLRHVEAYATAGVALTDLPLVGLGSVCRRQGTRMVELLIRELCAAGLRVHGFGFKLNGLMRAGPWLASADSMAWSFAARWEEPLPGCPHRSCQNCLTFALNWRARVLDALRQACRGPLQLDLFLGASGGRAGPPA